MHRFRFLALVFCLVTVLTRLGGQTTTGSIVGTVSDPSGAVISGANITVNNMDTGIAVKASSDSTGNYVVTPLAVGRYFSRLAILTAGTAPTPAGARDEKTGGFSSNGVRPYQNNYLLDGVENNSMSEDMVNQASYVVGPPPDAIAEFKVQTNSMSAEFGRSGGAVLNVTIKSITTQVHGTAYESLRDSALDA